MDNTNENTVPTEEEEKAARHQVYLTNEEERIISAFAKSLGLSKKRGYSPAIRMIVREWRKMKDDQALPRRVLVSDSHGTQIEDGALQ